MSGSALILGSIGRFGRAAATAFRAAGWKVTEWRRPDPGAAAMPSVIRGDLTNRDALHRAAEVDVIVNALNPAYTDWEVDLPWMTAAVTDAAKATGATVLIPGNVYNYGQNLPPRLSAATPHIGDHKKARQRIEMEAAYRSNGVKTIILRGGDFIDTAPGDNWFEGQMTAKVAKGTVVYPGPTNLKHTWAFLPNMARAAEMLAARRGTLPEFADIGFPGYALTGDELMDLIERAAGRPLKRGGMPWFVLNIMGLFNPLIREVAAMRYLWNRPHGIEAAEFDRVLPDFQPTEPIDAVRASLSGCGQLHGPNTGPLAPAKGSAITA
ncbi:MAG: NAD(P)H-binding protein [Paracoccaceae bacterium]|nr:NAD(P)H-binding protein [Paracoccaceae bacterium]MDG1369476.1 NAD(P)H-binding protein [Paracoccaceae bacterium]